MNNTFQYYRHLAENLTSIDDLKKLLVDIYYYVTYDPELVADIVTKINSRIKAIKNKDRTDRLLKNTDVTSGWILTDPYSNKERYKKIDQHFILSYDNLDIIVDNLFDTISTQVSRLGNGVILIDLRESVIIDNKFNYIPDINLGAMILENGVISYLRDNIYRALSNELNKSIPYTEDTRRFYINSINMYFYHETSGSKSSDNNCLFHALNIYDTDKINKIRNWWNVPTGPITLYKAHEIVDYLKLSNIIPLSCNIVTDRKQASYNDIILEHDHYDVVTHGWKPINIPSIDKFSYIITHYDIETYRKHHTDNISEFSFSVAGISITNEINHVLLDFSYTVNILDILNISVNVALTQGVDHVYLNAYNGRSFDHYILLEASINVIDIKKYTNKKNQLLRVDFLYNNITFVMWDLNKIIDGTLDQNMLQLLNMHKYQFTRYDEIDIWDNMSQELREELVRYLYHDVVGLRELYIKLNTTYKALGFDDIVRYISASQMTFNNYLLRHYTKDNTIMIPPANVDNNIRSACYGGRCHPVRQEFNSNGSDDDVLVARDIVSLYPAALCEEYPVGVPKLWCYKDKDIISKIESGQYMAICFVAFDGDICTLIEPILPKRTSDNGHLEWDFLNGEGWYTSISINIARSYGYRFVMQNGYYWENKSTMFKDYIKNLFSIRQQYAKNHPLNLLAKILLNGFYGKLIQRPVSTEVKICNNADETYNEIHRAIVISGLVKRYVIGNKVFLEIDYPKRNHHVIKPSHYGAFCLDYSKKIVMKYMLEYNALRNKTNLFYYINTDCIYIHKSQIPDNTNNNTIILGGMKDEYNAGIIKAIFISPKIYYLLLSDGNEIMHMKGVDVKKSNINIWHYIELAAGRDIEVVIPFQITKNMFPRTKINGQHIKALTLYYQENVKIIISPNTWNSRILDNGYYVPNRHNIF